MKSCSISGKFPALYGALRRYGGTNSNVLCLHCGVIELVKLDLLRSGLHTMLYYLVSCLVKENYSGIVKDWELIISRCSVLQ